MANASMRLVEVLRTTARRLGRAEVTYRWSHFAHCNCGHLAQTITALAPAAIYQAAVRQEGDWGEQARRFEWPDYGDRPALDEGAWEPENIGTCRVTGTPMDELLTQMAELGLSADDVRHLERLSDPRVRRALGTNTSHFAHNRRENVVAYLNAWANLLEAELPEDERAAEAPPALAAE